MVKIWLIEQIQNPKVGAFVAAATTTSAGGSIFGWIPHEIARFSLLIGIILSSTIIVVTVAKEARDRQKHRLEVQKMEMEVTLLREKLRESI